jgi:Protein of unknown function (DUF3383)/PEP-CTERM motif
MTESKLRYAATLPLAAASLIASALLAERANAQSNPYALDRLFLAQGQSQPFDSVLSFNSVTAVENYYGVSTEEATLAQDFFAGYTGTSANMLFTRLPVLSARAHLVGGNVSNLSLAQLQAINGTISVTSQGYNYSASINLSGVTGTGTTAFKNAAYIIQTDLNNSLPPAAAATGSITPVSVAFTGSVNNLLLTVSSAPPGSIQVGSIITGRGMPAGAQITSQVSGTPNGAGVYSLYVPEGHISSGTLTETYGVLKVGSASSGTVAIGQQVTGASVLPLTAIESNLGGGAWLVNYAQTVGSENMTMTRAPLSVVYTPVTGATKNSGSFSIQQNGDFLYNSSSVSYATGNAANSLYLAQGTGPAGQQATLNSPGEIVAPNGCAAGASDCISVATFMNNLLAENDMFSSFQTTWDPANYIPPGEEAALEAWVENEDAQGGQYTYLENYSDTTPPIAASEDPSAKRLFATAGATVPEPSTWAMALLGFAGLGLMARYRPGRSTCPSGRRIASTGRPSGDVPLSL